MPDGIARSVCGTRSGKSGRKASLAISKRTLGGAAQVDSGGGPMTRPGSQEGAYLKKPADFLAHLLGHESVAGAPGESGKRNFADHPDYSAKVGQKLTPIMNRYKNEILRELDKAEDHELPNFKLAKERLEKVSRDFYSQIMGVGPSFTGKSLDEMF